MNLDEIVKALKYAVQDLQLARGAIAIGSAIGMPGEALNRAALDADNARLMLSYARDVMCDEQADFD